MLAQPTSTSNFSWSLHCRGTSKVVKRVSSTLAWLFAFGTLATGAGATVVVVVIVVAIAWPFFRSSLVLVAVAVTAFGAFIIRQQIYEINILDFRLIGIIFVLFFCFFLGFLFLFEIVIVTVLALIRRYMSGEMIRNRRCLCLFQPPRSCSLPLWPPLPQKQT